MRRSHSAPNSACASAPRSVLHHLRDRCHDESPHQQREAQPGPPGCSKLSLEGLRVTSFDPLVVTKRVVLKRLLENSARPLPSAPRLVPDRPRGWQRLRHLQQVITAAGSRASPLPCRTNGLPRGVARSTSTSCPASTSMVAADAVGEGCRHHRDLVGNTFAGGLVIALHVCHLDVRRLSQALC